MELHTWLILLVTSAGMSLTPGPNSLLVMTHSALHGRRKTLPTILGGLLGFVVIIALCLFGIGALVKASVVWLTALKWVGGAYLVWLGIQVWRSPPIDMEVTKVLHHVDSRTLFRQGLLSALTNPKGMLFFSAFLPQFIDPQRGMAVQFVVIATTYAFTEFLAEFGLACATCRVRPWLSRVGKRFNRVCGGLFVLVGAALPLRA